MRRDDLGTSWDWLVAAVAGAVTWALVEGLAGVLVGLVVALLVLGTKLTLDRLAGGRPRRDAIAPTSTVELPPPGPHSEARRWLRRADGAAGQLRALAANDRGWLQQNLHDVDGDAALAVVALHRVGSRLALLDGALADIDRDELEAARRRLAPTGDVGNAALDVERAKARRRVDEQLATQRRLQLARDTLSVRMESTVLGLEGVVARMREVLAAADSADGTDEAGQVVSDATTELEALRLGLAEVEALGAGALPGQPPVKG